MNITLVPFALSFDGWSIEEVRQRIRECAEMPATDLHELSMQVMEYANRHYTNEAFADKFRDIVSQLI